MTIEASRRNRSAEVAETTTPYPSDENLRIRRGKDLLRDLGTYPPLGSSGSMDQTARQCVAHFQATHGLAATGDFNDETLRRLEHELAQQNAPSEQDRLNRELQESKSAFSDAIDHAPDRLRSAAAAVYAHAGRELSQLKNTLSLAPGEALSIKAEGEIRELLGIELQAEVSLKREQDGSYTLECGSKAGGTLGIEGTDLHARVGSKATYHVKDGAELLKLGTLLASLPPRASVLGLLSEPALKRERAWLLNHTTQLTVNVGALGEFKHVLGGSLKTELGFSLESASNVSLNFKDGKVKSLELKGESKATLEGAVSFANPDAGALSKLLALKAKGALSATYEQRMTVALNNPASLLELAALKRSDLQFPQTQVKVTFEPALTTKALKEVKQVETLAYTLVNPEKASVEVLAAALHGPKGAVDQAILGVLKRAKEEHSFKTVNVSGLDKEHSVGPQKTKAKLQLEREHTEILGPHAAIAYYSRIAV